MSIDYGVKDIKTLEGIEVGFRFTPSLEIIFQTGETYKLDIILSMEQTIENNFNFKNSYKFTTALLPLGLLKLLESSSVHQIKEIKIIDEFKTAEGIDYIEVHSISLPIFSLSRSVNEVGLPGNWIIKITEKIG
jgi:hypothetical protein